LEATMTIALSPAAQVSLVIIALINVLLLIGLVSAVVVAVTQFKKLREQVQPVIDRVTPILEEVKPVVANVNPLLEGSVRPILGNIQEITHKVSGIVGDVGAHVHSIAETGEHTVKEITHRVEATGQVVTDNVSKPVISAASMFAGISRAFSVLKHYQNDDAPSAPAHTNGDGATASASSRK